VVVRTPHCFAIGAPELESAEATTRCGENEF
jgi:hypothetical protein